MVGLGVRYSHDHTLFGSAAANLVSVMPVLINLSCTCCYRLSTRLNLSETVCFAIGSLGFSCDADSKCRKVCNLIDGRLGPTGRHAK